MPSGAAAILESLAAQLDERPGAQVAQPERLTGLSEEMAAVAGAVVGHDPAHADG